MPYRYKYYVVKREMCKKCNGSGYLMHPIWEKIHEENPTSLTENEIKEYFKKYGILEVPPEWLECDICKGSGFITEYVPLIDAIKETQSQLT